MRAPEGVAPPERELAIAREAEPALAERGRERHAALQVGEPRDRAQAVRVVGQARDGLVLQRPAVPLLVVGEELDLHPRHVDAGRALALAALAADAKVQRLEDGIARQRIRSELARQREPQRVRPAARQMLLVARDAKARAHRSGVELAAVAVVVAHLDGLGEAAGRVAAAAGCRDLLGARIVLHVPRRPVERGNERDRPVRRGCCGGREAEQRAVVHLRRIDDLAGVEQAFGVERVLDRAKRVVERRAELPRDPFAAAQAVAVLAAVRALVAAHERRRLLGDRAHLRRAVAPHVEDRPHVQRADRRVRVPGAARSVAREHLGQRVGVVGEVRERHRAVLDEADRLAVALQAHHDVEAGLPHLPEALLRAVVGHLDDASRQAQVAHQRDEMRELRDERRLRVAGELDQQDRRRFARKRALHRRRESGVGEREVDHRPVDQLDRRRAERDDVLRRLHRLAEGREVDDAEHLRAPAAARA